MSFNKKFLLVMACGIILNVSGDTKNSNNIIELKIKLNKEIENKKTELNNIACLVDKQERDSIANFDKKSKNSWSLQLNQRQKLKLQIRITEIVEQSLREYWFLNFQKYKDYIYSSFSQNEIQELAKYAGQAHFSLTCDIDTNYYKSLDEILYGPYWREFASCIRPDTRKLAKKYINVRQSAQNKYPYIFTKNVFYDGQSLTKDANSMEYENKIFTNAIETGREIFRDESGQTDTNMCDFNKLRNVSDIFTSDLHFFVESIYWIPEKEVINLQSELFVTHSTELSDLVNQIKTLDSKIKILNIQHDKDINNIKQHFKNVAVQRQNYKSAEINVLKNVLENITLQNTR